MYLRHHKYELRYGDAGKLKTMSLCAASVVRIRQERWRALVKMALIEASQEGLSVKLRKPSFKTKATKVVLK